MKVQLVVDFSHVSFCVLTVLLGRQEVI